MSMDPEVEDLKEQSRALVIQAESLLEDLTVHTSQLRDLVEQLKLLGTRHNENHKEKLRP